MESRIPVPTDNIYKFYALFGLLLVISSLLGSVYVTQSANESVHAFAKEYFSIANPDLKEPSGLEQFIAKRITTTVENRKFYQQGIGVFLGVGIMMMFYGFYMWHMKVQPLQDRLMKLQIEKLERELDNHKESGQK